MKKYELIKTDHDSDCAVHNEPAYPKGLCNCGLIPNVNKGIGDYIKITSPHIHEGEANGLANAFQSGYNFKSALSDDIEFLLSEFKEEEPSYFDKFGKHYKATPIGSDNAELMRHLIFKLEEHIRQTDNTDYAF